MRQRSPFTAILILVCLILFSLTSCKSEEAENDVLEEIRSAPVVKLESTEQQDSCLLYTSRYHRDGESGGEG